MKGPLVSIIVPVYKVPQKFFRQCVESCINQTLRNIEIILVDDGSPDKCKEICDEYAAEDKRINVIHKENGGLAAARNSGQDAAIGETMMFLDGDDYLEPNCCELAYKTLKKNNVELVMFDSYLEFFNTEEIEHSFDDGKRSRLFTGDDCRKLQARVLNFNGRIAMAFMKLMRTDFLREYNIRHVDKLRQGAEGLVFNIQLYEYVKRAYYLDKPLLHYVYNQNSISHKSTIENNYMILHCFDWISNYIRTSYNPIDLEPYLLNRLLYVICTTAITGYFNPYNKEKYSVRINEFRKFMCESIVVNAMKCAPRTGIGKQRKLILRLIQFKMYPLLLILGKARRYQLEHK